MRRRLVAFIEFVIEAWPRCAVNFGHGAFGPHICKRFKWHGGDHYCCGENKGVKKPDGGLRFVSAVKNTRRLEERPTVRVQDRDGVERIVAGASQGLFRVPRSEIIVARAA